MRKDKKKVKYIFEGEVDNQGPVNPVIQSDRKLNVVLVESDPKRNGSSGQAPD